MAACGVAGGIQNRFGSLFFILIYMSVMSLSSLPLWMEDRLLFIRSPPPKPPPFSPSPLPLSFHPYLPLPLCVCPTFEHLATA